MSMSEGSTAENGRDLVWIVVVVSERNAVVCTRNRYQSLSWGLSIVSVESPKPGTKTLATMCLRTPLVESLEFRNAESANTLDSKMKLTAPGLERSNRNQSTS